MKQLITLSAALALALSTSAFANSHKEAPGMAASGAMTKQQSKMGDCNKEAGDKKGDDRKAFMKTCLSAKPMAAAKPESKMSMCNKKTAGMAKDERAKAQSECMKG
jgi:hypothetical protein